MFDKDAKNTQRRKAVYLLIRTGNTESTCKRIKSDCNSHHLQKLSQDKDLKIKYETMKYLEENTKKNLHEVELCNDFHGYGP